MLATQTTALQSSTILKEKTLAKIVADNQLTMFKVSDYPPQPGRHTGSQTQAGVEFDWNANVQHVAAQNLVSISLSVQSPENNKPIYQITGFRKL